MKIKTIIVEDEINARKALENMLLFYCPEVEVAGYAATIEEGVELINRVSPDLLLLDIQIKDGTSFDILKKIKKKNLKIIFITAHDQYALKAIKLSAMDYLLKPVSPSELKKAVDKVIKALDDEEHLKLQIETTIENFGHVNQNKKIILNTNQSVFVVEIKHLIRCESNENYTNIYVEGGKQILISKTLKDFEEMLTPYGFFRVHQSHLINLQFVESFEKKGSGKVRLSTGDKVPVSSRRKEDFLKVLRAFSG